MHNTKQNPNMFQQIKNGATLLGVLMHRACATLDFDKQTVLDVGSGKKLNKYHYFFKVRPAKIYTVDMKDAETEHRVVDLEKDKLPFDDTFFDSVLAFNILEHIYNHQFLTTEMYRVTKHGGKLVGFVPFLVNYHPDPHDYFRYTEEALKKLFTDVGYTEIVIIPIGKGPFYVSYNDIVLSVPRIVRVVLLPFALFLDAVFVYFRPAITRRYPLGYFFIAEKK
jgi:SAM-dependent methyltransferase